MLHKEIPFLRILVPMCAGIICGLRYSPDNLFFIISMPIVLTGLLSSIFFYNQFSNGLFGLTLSLAFFTSGLFLYTNEKERISILKTEETVFTGYLEDYPEEKSNSVLIAMRIENTIIKDTCRKVSGTILLYTRKDSIFTSFLPGDLLTVNCTPIGITNRGNPYEFDYKRYSENNGIRYYSFTSGEDFIRHASPTKRKLKHRALIVRERIINMFRERGITGERLALVAAITLGQKNMLDQEQKDNFINAGVMHIMAVSGLHAVILSLFIFKMLFFLKGRLNVIRVSITFLILWSFAFITGLTPSVLRATLMFTFLQTGGLMKRQVNPINSVLASAFVLIIIKPSVIFNSGFLLSYSAVIFIISFYRNFYNMINYKQYIPDLVWKSAAVTIIAQAGTLALTITMFNKFPTLFILSNILIVPLATLIIILGCLVPLTFPFTLLSYLLAELLDKTILLTDFLTKTISSIPFSSIENTGLTRAEAVVLLAFIFLMLTFILKKKQLSVVYPLLALFILIMAGTVKNITVKNSKEIIVYNSAGQTAIGIRTGRELHYFSDSALIVKEALKHSATLNLRINSHLLTGGLCEIDACNKKILIAGSVNDIFNAAARPDIAIIMSSVYRPAAYTVQEKGPGMLVFSSGVSADIRIKKAATLTGYDTLHFVKHQGAFRLGL